MSDEGKKRRKALAERMASLVTGKNSEPEKVSEVRDEPSSMDGAQAEDDVEEVEQKEIDNKVSAEEWDKLAKIAHDIVRLNVPHRVMDESSVHAGMTLLCSPELLKKLNEELSKTVAGEYYSRLAILLCASQIWVSNPRQMTHCMINSSSSSGKDFVTKAVYDLFPVATKDFRTKITSEAFTYWHATKKDVEDGFSWDGRLLYLEDCSQGLLDSPTFRVMLSGGSISTIVKDQRAIDLEIKGRPVVLITTASTIPKQELLNRFISVSLEETAEQTSLVFDKTVEVALGNVNPPDETLRNALRLLVRVRVIIPSEIGNKLKVLFPAKPVNMRREFARFLAIMQNSTALHQHTREKNEKGEVLATWQDYDNACYVFKRNPIKLTRSQQAIYDAMPSDQWLHRKEINILSKKGSSWTYELLLQLVELDLVKVKLDETEATSKAQDLFMKVPTTFGLPTSEILKAR